MTNDLAIAKAALRDGLWDVARTHAQKSHDDAAKLIVLESYAHEENWKGLLAAYDAMGYPAGDGFAYYRALALFKGGSVEASSNVLAGVSIMHTNFVRSAARLRAAIALANRDPGVALSILEREGGEDVETKLMTASICADSGKSEEAKRLWRGVAANTNATERAKAVAAAGLSDAVLLETLSTNAVSGAVRRFVALRLGQILLGETNTFARGERMIRTVTHDAPDSEGAREAFLALAQAQLNRAEYANAEKSYSDALTIWPELVRSAALHEGRGWAQLEMGNPDKAMDSFRRAKELATDPERKAAIAVKMADILALKGNAKEATEAYQKIRRDYSNTIAAVKVARVIHLRELEERGHALYDAFNFAEARKTFAALAKEDPAHRERLAFYDVCCAYGAGEDDKAESEARELAEDAKDVAVRAAATHWLAKFAFNRSRWREAADRFVAFAEMSPQSPDAPHALVWSARASMANNDFKAAVSNVARLVSRYAGSPACAAGMRVQGEALIELARFDEAVLVLDRAALVKGASDADRLQAHILRADALFAMGADNPARYEAALEAYEAIRTGEMLTPSAEIAIAFKIGRTLEKLKRINEAIDTYYTQVVLAYRTGRLAGTNYDEPARTAFVRAAFRLAESHESRGQIRQAIHVLDLVRTSDVQAADEAAKRIKALSDKGTSL